MKYLPLNPDIFVQNRKRFIAKMEKNAIAIFNSNDELPSNGDGQHRFKQNSDIIWLSGIEQEESMSFASTEPKARMEAWAMTRFLLKPNLERPALRSDKEARIAFAILFDNFLCSTNDVLADCITVEVRLLHAEDQRANNGRAIQPNQFCFR